MPSVEQMMLLFVLASIWAPRVSAISPPTGEFFALGLNDKAFTEGIIFESPAISPAECAARCNQIKSCVVFTFHPTSCRGYAVLVTSSAVSVPAAGARSFARDWRYLPCADNSDCTVTKAKCFKGQCLCKPGYFYSVGTGACVKTCTKLQPTYSAYPESGILNLNKISYSDTDAAQCQAYCTADPECLNVDFKVYGVCHINKVTPLSNPEAWMTSHDDPPATPWLYFYQRDCA